jgi:hypothetical protein
MPCVYMYMSGMNLFWTGIYNYIHEYTFMYLYILCMYW